MKFIKINKMLVGVALATTLFVGGALPSTINPFETTSVEASTKVTQNNKIMGTSTATAEQMAQFVKNKKPNGTKLKGVTIDQLAKIYIEEGAKEGVRGDVAFAQAILETGYFIFAGSSVTPDQHNYAGIGTTGGGVKGHYFKDARTGVRAQIQHLKAYGSKEPLKQANVDPRFKYVTRGIAPTFQDLHGRWAMKQGANYGDVILGLHKEILNTKVSISSSTSTKISTNPAIVTTASTKYTATANLNVRASASTSAKKVTSVSKGTTIVTTKTQKVGSTTWFYATIGSKKGWVSGAYLKPVTVAKSTTSKAATVSKSLTTKSNLNLRATAGTKGKYLTTLAKGTKVVSTKTQKVGSTTWHYVSVGKKTGWVSGAYLKA